MEHLIIHKDGVYTDSRTINGLYLLKFRKASIVGTPNYANTEGRRGLITKGKRFEGRSIVSEWYLKGKDKLDVELLIDEVMELFHNEKEMSVIHNIQPGKQWFVHADTDFTPTWISPQSVTFELGLYAPYPYARSLGTSLDPLVFDSNLWQVGQGLLAEEMNYIHTENSFKVFNPSSIEITPNEHPLVISIKGRTNQVELMNLTTGDSFRYYGSTNLTDQLILDRIDHYKNGQNITHDTNHGIIKLAKGWNDFRVLGSNGAEIKIDFPFYYV